MNGCHLSRNILALRLLTQPTGTPAGAVVGARWSGGGWPLIKHYYIVARQEVSVHRNSGIISPLQGLDLRHGLLISCFRTRLAVCSTFPDQSATTSRRYPTL